MSDQLHYSGENPVESRPKLVRVDSRRGRSQLRKRWGEGMIVGMRSHQYSTFLKNNFLKNFHRQLSL